MNLTPLDPSDESPEAKPFSVCDIETMNWTKFLSIGLYDGTEYVAFHISGKGIPGSKRPLRDFLAHLFSLKIKKQTVYAHFGGIFDFAFILEEALQVPGLSVENLIPRGSGILCFNVVEYCPHSGKKLYTVHFSDSSALLPFGLKNLCKNFGVEHNKLDWDHTKTTGVTRPLLHYNKIDCLGLYEVIEKYRKWPMVERAGSRSTMASQALQVLRLYLESPVKSISGDRVEGEICSPDQFIRESYVGGRTEVFKPFVNPGTSLYCADVNSLYPYIMRETTMPNRSLEFTHDYDPHTHGFYDAVIQVPSSHYIPCLGTQAVIRGSRYNSEKDRMEKYKAKKFIFPTGTVKGRWTTLEIEYARSIGCKLISTGLGLKFSNGGKLFGGYIDDLYAIRQKSERDSVDNIIAKLLMNSCYGRTGLQRRRDNLIIDDGTCGREEYCEITLPEGKVKLMVDPTYLHNTFSNVAVAAWVTAASRIHMHKIYRKYEKDVYYTDTDSLFMTKSLGDSDELGELKIEYESNEGACFLLPKTYCIEGIKDKKFTRKVVMKGFDKKAANLLKLGDFKYALEGDLSKLKAVMPPKFSTFKTAIRSGKIVTMRPGYIRKIVSQYDKRSVFKDIHGEYQSLPLDLAE